MVALSAPQIEFGERPTLTPLVMEQGLVDLQETLSNMVILQAMQYRELAVGCLVRIIQVILQEFTTYLVQPHII